MADGNIVTIEGVLTTALGSLEAGRTGFVQDASGGIALYLDAAYPTAIPAGTIVRASGTLSSRYGERTLRVGGADVAAIALAGLPSPADVLTGAAGEAVEGLRLRVSGIVTAPPDALADGLGVTVDDGSGPVRLVVGPDALGDQLISTGREVTAIGPLGQRDSSGTGASGYRLHATLPGELVLAPEATPTPSSPPAPSPSSSPGALPSPTPSASAPPSPSASPTPSHTPSAPPTPTPTPAPTPAPTPVPVSVGEARQVAVGRQVLVRGVVTAEAGRLGTPRLFAIGDATGGLPVRLADGMAGPPRGMLVELRGVIADPYGQTELRLAANGLKRIGTASVPAPRDLSAGEVGEAIEGQLVKVSGTITVGATKAASGDLAATLTRTDGATLKVYADASAGFDVKALKKGVSGVFTGIVGQHATRKGATDGYRLWLRDRDDVAHPAAASASPSPSSTPGASGVAPTVEPIATARVRDGASVTVIGVVTADRSLLDSSGRRTVIEDGTGAIELYLPSPDTSVRLGARLRVTGSIGRAWGAPRLHADQVSVLDSAAPSVLDLHAAPGPTTEWRLVRIIGTVTSVHRAGDRWVAELDTGFGTVPVIAQSGAAIPATAIAEGRRATVTGIVKRPYPTASDRRYAVLPRRTADIVLGAPAASGAGASGSTAVPGASRPPLQADRAMASTDVRDLAGHIGQRVRVGGLVTESTADGIRLDDGTGAAGVVLAAAAADLASVVGPGDAVDVIGTVELRDVPVLVVRDPADVTLGGDLGAEAAAASPALAALVIESATPSAVPAPVEDASPRPLALGVVAGAITALAAAAAFAARRLRDRRRQRAILRRRLAAWASGAPTTSLADG